MPDKSIYFTVAISILFLMFVSKVESGFNDESCPQKLSGKGTIHIPSNETCNHYILRSKEEKSIFRLRLEASYNLTANFTSKEELECNLNVDFKEEKSENGESKSVTVASWNITSDSNKSKLIYISRYSLIEIEIKGEWTGPELLLKYDEITLGDDTKSSSDLKGEIEPWVPLDGRGYRPNHISLFQIKKSREMNESSISLTLKYLDIDEDIGEYLLFGAGLNPFEGSPPIFISQSFDATQPPKTYFINDENAYIVFVARATRKHHMGFKILWEQTGTRISVDTKKDDDSVSEDVLNSIAVCIYNLTAAEKEFSGLNPLEWFKDFRTEFAKEANEYAVEENIQLHSNVTPHQVEFYRISAVLPMDENHEDLNEGALYVMLRIRSSDKDRAVFGRNQMLHIFNRYTECCVNVTKSYMVKNCPIPVVHERRWGTILLYCLIPVSGCLFLLVWMWKRNPLTEYFGVKKNGAFSGKDVTNENLYVCVPNGTLQRPKMYLTSEHGKKVTLYDDDSDIELFNKADLNKIREMSGSLHHDSTRSSVKSRESMKGVSNKAFVNTEENDRNLPHDSNDMRKEENFYDSLKSRKNYLSNKSEDNREFTKF